MIWYACKQCGKRLRQPDSAAGSFVFCECGGGNRVPWESTLPPPETPAEPPALEESRPPEPAAIDPAYCLNHQDVPSEVVCDDCREHFCPACVLRVRGKTLCGPCKNLRLARLQRPPRTSGMAIV